MYIGVSVACAPYEVQKQERRVVPYQLPMLLRMLLAGKKEGKFLNCPLLVPILYWLISVVIARWYSYITHQAPRDSLMTQDIVTQRSTRKIALFALLLLMKVRLLLWCRLCFSLSFLTTRSYFHSEGLEVYDQSRCGIVCLSKSGL